MALRAKTTRPLLSNLVEQAMNHTVLVFSFYLSRQMKRNIIANEQCRPQGQAKQQT